MRGTNFQELKRIVATIKLPEIVLGYILSEFSVNKIPSSEIYRRIGSRFSIDKKIIRACLILLQESDAIEFRNVCHESYILIKR